ncbi:MAG: PilN domain-containing protein [bacterium]|nr:PilN domain-containing protein [bacterium]
MKRYINLLPPDFQKQVKLEKLQSQVVSFGIWSAVSLLVFATILFASFVVLKQSLIGLAEEVAVQTKVLDEIKETSVRKEVEIYNNNLKNFETLAAARNDWSVVLMEIARTLPKDMTIDSLTINRLDKKVELGGHSRSRDQVLQFRKNLVSSSYFTNVNFPLANLEKPTDLNWKYRFFLNPAPTK